MIQGTQSPDSIPGNPVRPHIRPRATRLKAAYAAVGRSSARAIARLAEIDPKSVRRAMAGEQVGEVFIAATLATLGREEYVGPLAEIGVPPTFDSLFELVA